MNIDDSDQIQLLCNQLSDTPIDCLINNAGVLGGKNALITPQESVLGMRKLITQYHEYESGGFYSYDGKEIPW